MGNAAIGHLGDVYKTILVYPNINECAEVGDISDYTRQDHAFHQIVDSRNILIELKLRAGVKLSRSENQFFGGPQMFRHNILRYIKAKEV